MAVDIETRDPLLTKLGPGVRRRNPEDRGYIVGVSFAIEDGPAAYLPIRHEAGGNLDETHVLQYLTDQAALFKGDLVGANLQYDLDYLEEEGVVFHPAFFRDITIAEPILDELQFRYGLDAVAERRGVPGKDEVQLANAAAVYGLKTKADLWQLPSRHVGAYAEQDARLPLRLLRIQERLLEDQGLWDIYDLESRLLPVLLAMRRRGVAVDLDRLEEVEAWGAREEVNLTEQFDSMVGPKVTFGDLNKNRLIAEAIESLGVKLPRTKPSTRYPSGQPSVKAEVLKAIDHPAVTVLLEAKAYCKMRTTFVKSVRKHEVDGRIHTTFNQLRREKEDGGDAGAISGRVSSCDLNLQQQPNRHPKIGPKWRSIYVPDDGGEWAVLDYSQQEPRWLTHFAEECNCTGAQGAAQRYRDDPTTDNHAMMAALVRHDYADLAAEEQRRVRSAAKTIFLALCYGMGGAKLCRSLGLDTKWIRSRKTGRMLEVAGDEGSSLIRTFNARVPYVPQLAELVKEKVEERGWIRTILGRICRFPEDQSGHGYDWTHIALNRLIQGSSADQTKKAMVDADAAGFRLQLQVHDELDLTIWDRQQALDLSKLMANCVPCNVPHLVEPKVGPNWGSMEKLTA